MASAMKILEQRDTNPVITISRERGSGGRTIAYLLAKKLKSPWRVFHKDIVEEITQDTDSTDEQNTPLDEQQIVPIKEQLGRIFGNRIRFINTHYKHLLHILTAIGSQGNAIILGRGAHFLFPHALKIRIVSKVEDRIRSLIKYEHISAKEAKKQIDESDAERTIFTKRLFKHNLCNAHHYDLIICTGKDMSVEDATDVIISLAKKKFK